MKVYINDSIVVINNKYEKKLFIFDRLSRNQFDINEETFNCLQNIRSNKYSFEKLNEIFEENFINQLFELNILTFERQRSINNIKKLEKYNNVRLFIELTNKCNLRCKHCYGNFGEKNDKIIDINKIKKVIYDASKCGAYQLDLTGGEPMLYPYLEELLKFSYNEGMLVRIFSNLTLLNLNNINILTKYGVKEIVTSLDSCNEITHDNFRGSSGCFNKTIKAIEILKEKGISISVNTMIGSHNKNEIDKLVHFITELNVKSVLDIIVPEGRGFKLNENIKESAKIIRGIYKDYYKIIDKNAISTYCGIGNRFIYIKSDGNIYICPNLIFDEYKLGNIDNYNTEKIWKDMTKRFSFIKCNSKCKKCGKCNGGCRARALKMSNNICGNDEVYCVINDVGEFDD